MYSVLVIEDNKKARLIKNYKKIVRAGQLVRELQEQGKRAYLIKREDKE